MTESRDPYPGHVDASLDPSTSRGLWLVKWLLLIPHYIVLALVSERPTQTSQPNNRMMETV
jgi:uncharacterized membrane protein SirB2